MSQSAAIKTLITSQLGEESLVEVFHVSSKKIDLLIISPAFEGVDIADREILVSDVFTNSEIEIQIGLMSLYTEEEAEALGVTVSVEEETTEGYPSTWFDLMKWSLQGRQYRKIESTPKVVAFYSFKGGVGRTTALVHAAWALANKGKKVVMIDMDFEAPSLHHAVGKKKNESLHGLVDYLYERMNLFGDQEPQIKVTDLLEEVEVQEGRLLVIPAGRVDIDYITKVDDLRHLPVYNLNLWNTFKQELVDQVQPDLILIDSRTGINQWGALSILTIADESMLFVNPNPQNREGVSTILTALNRVGILPQVVLSPVIDNDIGRDRANLEWEKISEVVWEGSKGKSVTKKPILIPYSSGVALADEYPHRSSLLHYQKIVELLDDEADRPRLRNALRKRDLNVVLESFCVQKGTQADEPQMFPGIEKFIDPTTVVIKGRRGVGKTTLFSTALNQMDKLREHSSNRLENVQPIIGHSGAEYPSGISIDYNKVEKTLNEQGGDWRSFWLVFTYVQLLKSQSDAKNQYTTDKVLPPLMQMVDSQDRLLEFVQDTKFVEIVENELKRMNHFFAENGATYWVLYDGFEEIPYEQHDLNYRIVSGLLSFALFLEEFKLKNIRPKIFLHTSTWSALDESISRRFLGKDMEIKWTWPDLLQLLYAHVMQSSEFKQIVEEYVGRSKLQKTSLETIIKALDIVWGNDFEVVGGGSELEVSGLIHYMLEDGNGDLFPSTILTLFREAVKKQLFKKKEAEFIDSDDRLLDWNSLVNGHNAARDERLEILSKEYPLIINDVIDFVEEFPNPLFTWNDLMEWYIARHPTGVSKEIVSKQILESGYLDKVGKLNRLAPIFIRFSEE